ncbi:hypothetical protein [Methylobacterium ajmalii]|jgi:hypothetical protein|uniref:hypothetical protein n=1 Tax=Methylobacterium ajmalii TaxID=2738439 RepID=UPI00190DF1CA|nr:hypothetical protein [Methylobacterium ajmalii]MBK3399083.1 hypothetical protein [Methylobacterium ajmalii]MBK3412288.1 hypothetical protein [Methylobacterium ajmalii]MBK3426797.1 hypothetical protein [Methylobacterium ajmalii]
MPSLNLRNVLRRDPSRPSLRDRAAALKVAARLVTRPPKLEAGAPATAEAGAIVDRILISLVQEFVAIGKAQDETLAATNHPDAFDHPDWVRLEQRGVAVLARIVSTRAHTVEGMQAKASLLDLCRIKSFAKPFDDLSRSVQSDADAIGVAPPLAGHADPHVAMLPALRQAFAWTRDAHPLGECASNSPEDRAFARVLTHCWHVAKDITALPPPSTLAGLGALALALSVNAEEAIGRPKDDGMDDQRYTEERRLAAAIRAMMAVSGVEPLPEWAGFEAGPDSDAKWEALKARAGKGSAPAWAFEGKAGPDDMKEV